MKCLYELQTLRDLILTKYCTPSDKWARNSRIIGATQALEVFHNKKLVEIATKGNPFTQSNNKKDNNRIYEKLDRGWCNIPWMDKYVNSFRDPPDCKLISCPFTSSFE